MVARPLLTPFAQKLSRYEHGVFTTEHPFILERYFALKSFAAVYETFNNVYLGKEVPNTTTLHRLVTFWDTGSVYLRKVLIGRQHS
jgi:hypothetical protein